MLNWNSQPEWFRVEALVTGVFAMLMSLVPTIVYVGMAPAIRSEVLLGGFIERGGPILLVFGLALIAARLVNPRKRQLTAATLLVVTMPAAVVLMLHGLR